MHERRCVKTAGWIASICCCCCSPLLSAFCCYAALPNQALFHSAGMQSADLILICQALVEENFRARSTLRCLKLGPVLPKQAPARDEKGAMRTESAALAHSSWAPDWPDDAFLEIKNLVTELVELQALELWGPSTAQRGLLTEVAMSPLAITRSGIKLKMLQESNK